MCVCRYACRISARTCAYVCMSVCNVKCVRVRDGVFDSERACVRTKKTLNSMCKRLCARLHANKESE